MTKNAVITARNQLGQAVRLNGDVRAARANLEVAKALRAIQTAVSAGASDASRRALAREALGRLKMETPEGFETGAIWRVTDDPDRTFRVLKVTETFTIVRYVGASRTSRIRTSAAGSGRYIPVPDV